MPAANAIAVVKAHMLDGSVVEYADSEIKHIREHRWDAINAGVCLALTVLTTDGQVFAASLRDGSLYAAGLPYPCPFPVTTRLRPIYYKWMGLETATEPGGSCACECEYFVVGWQTTDENGRNRRFGLRVYPAERRVDVSEDI